MAPPTEEGVRTAELVFVGTVTAVDANGFIADVTVHEVWRGDVANRMVLDGGLDPANPAEDDRRFEAGEQYLFMPLLVEGRWVDSICSGTVVWTDDLAAFRPAGVEAPAPGIPGPTGGARGAGIGLSELLLPIATVVIIGGATILVALLAARRREA